MKNIFGASSEPKEEKILPWIALHTTSQLDAIVNKSVTKAQVIFKHSTRCGISRMVMRQFVDAFELSEKNLDLYYLDLISYRDVSNQVARQFQVMHESPQLIIIKNGTTVVYASHGQINDLDLSRFV